MLCWKSSRKFFFEFAKIKFYLAKISRNMGIIIIICKGLLTRCRPGSGRRRARENASSSSQISKSELCESQTLRPLVFAFPSVYSPADGRGLWIEIISRKFRESYAKERAKVKVHVEGGGLVNFATRSCSEKGFRDISCMFKRLPRSDPWFFGVIWEVWTNFYKRYC